MKVVHEVRLAALELGRRLAEDGRLEDQRHIFMLQDKELEEAIAGNMAKEASDREKQYLQLFDLTPPFWFNGDLPQQRNGSRRTPTTLSEKLFRAWEEALGS